MKTNVPATLLERDSETSLPPGGGLAMVIVGSFVFWAALIWAVL
jgi:hypothetical protein